MSEPEVPTAACAVLSIVPLCSSLCRSKCSSLPWCLHCSLFRSAHSSLFCFLCCLHSPYSSLHCNTVTRQVCFFCEYPPLAATVTSCLHSLESNPVWLDPSWDKAMTGKRWGVERTVGHTHWPHTHPPGMRCPPRPLAVLISGDCREHEWKSLWDVQPLEDWVGEVSERTWVGPRRQGVTWGVKTEMGANDVSHSWKHIQSKWTSKKSPSPTLVLTSEKSAMFYLHGACLAVTNHGGPSLDIDWVRDMKCLVWLVLGEVLQTALIGLLVFILIGQRTRQWLGRPSFLIIIN